MKETEAKILDLGTSGQALLKTKHPWKPHRWFRGWLNYVKRVTTERERNYQSNHEVKEFSNADAGHSQCDVGTYFEHSCRASSRLAI